ncbi:MAG: Crp/Fnr family transcriptional regulator [Anaerolineae bacterium]
MLSQVDKIIFLKGVPFFANTTMQQLTALATACITENYEAHQVIVDVGDVPRALFMVASGHVRLTYFAGERSLEYDLDSRGYFGEAYVFDGSVSDFRAVSTNESMILSLAYEPLYTLIKKDLSLSYTIVRNLSKEIKNKNEKIAGMTRKHTRGMHQIFDKLDG